jgi:restriction endonuclease Mrr
VVDDKEMVFLIQAKRNRSRTSERGKARPVGLNDIKSFAATVLGQGHSQGVVVTTSHFTQGARRWVKKEGLLVSKLALVNGEEVRSRLDTIVRRNAPGGIASYLFDVAHSAQLRGT